MKMNNYETNLKFRRKISVQPSGNNFKRVKKLTGVHLFFLALRNNSVELKINNSNLLQFKHHNRHQFNKNHSIFYSYPHSTSNLQLQVKYNLDKHLNFPCLQFNQELHCSRVHQQQ